MFAYMQYVSQYNKNYSTLEEFQMRFELFVVHNAMITSWNNTPDITSTMGNNFLSDYTEAEKANLSGLKTDAMVPTSV